MPHELTNRQRQVLEFISSYIEQNGFPPSIREIARRMKIASTQGVVDHLTALERKGYIERGGSVSRGISVANVAVGRETPIVGRIAAGVPITAVENLEGTLLLDAAFSRLGQTFLLKVKGLSMKDAGILDGDLVLIRQQQTAEHGDVVAAILNDEATVKYFKRRNNAVTLEPANLDFEPIAVRKEDRFSIVGKVVACLRLIDGKLSKTIFKK
jgi:repressor LexA